MPSPTTCSGAGSIVRAKPKLVCPVELCAGSALPVGRVDLRPMASGYGDSGFAGGPAGLCRPKGEEIRLSWRAILPNDTNTSAPANAHTRTGRSRGLGRQKGPGHTHSRTGPHRLGLV